MLNFQRVAAVGLGAAVVATALTPAANAMIAPRDVVIVMDTTSSMRNEIAWAKEDARDIAQQVLSSHPDSRVGFVQYKDWASPMPNGRGQLAGAVSELPLTRNAAEFTSVVASLRTDDPGNTSIPEAVYSGILVAVDQQPWRENVGRNIIVIGDAPADDPEYKTCLSKQDVIAALDPRDLSIRINQDHGFGYNPNRNVADCTREMPAGPSIPLNGEKQQLMKPRVDILSPDGDPGPELREIAQTYGGKSYEYGDNPTWGITDVLDDIYIGGSPLISGSSGSSQITLDDANSWITALSAIIGTLTGLAGILGPLLRQFA
ncbi:hypothetical protein COCCU_06445 [Corynebacterium occultum]|uniref:VWFA domain-containing protein n=1 Tax=Corynebacterium occultum TaxID=2675219 RepID=A0A6B8W5J1_9CORY|nr:vWA domain-containing protein [Corynebacterium occultum]QGU07227.1 hypothetical protein COCCU_06445 [Corynebacterium occultum]